MPIPVSELKHDFVVVDERTTVRQVRDRVAGSGSAWTYVVVALANGKFTVLRLAALIRALQQHSPTFHPALLDLALGDLPELLSARSAEAVDRERSSLAEARARLGQTPGRRLVILDQGAVAGLLVVETRGLQRPVDLGWLDQPLREASAGMVAANGGHRRPGVLSVEPPPAAAAPEPAPAAPAEEPEQRWVNAEIVDHDPREPLQLDQVYTLAFDVDLQVRDASLVSDAPFSYRFAPGEELVELTVQLSSDDFSVYTDPQKLFVPRRGKSRNRARFDVQPKHEGQGIITAVFLKEGNFIQLVTLRLQVGGQGQPGLLGTEALGRPIDAATLVQPRDLSITILNTGADYRMIVAGPVSCLATLPLTLPHVAQMIDQVRQELLKIVHLEVGPDRRLPYQDGLDIPPKAHQEALRIAARAGFRLYQQLFYGPAADAQLNLIGDRLREMACGAPLKIQIVAQHFVLPWAVLYLAETFDPDQIDPDLFLGLRHSVEHIPLQPSMRVVDTTIGSQPSLTVGLNVNADIDQQMGIAVVADQLRYWGRISQGGPTRTVLRKTDREVTQALADAQTADQILYFYCHAISQGLGEAGGPDASCLVFGGDRRLTLADLNLYAPARQPLAGAPLVFVNACESAELSPLFYDGFVPYFMSKGARGVIGTECSTPALFAAAWADRFFTRFLGGEPLDQAVLGLRREFLERHNNLLGLLYAVYCDGDTRIVPGVPLG